MKKQIKLVALGLAMALVTGCSEDTADGDAADKTTRTTPAIDGSQFLLEEEPADSLEVIAAREKTQDGDDVVVVGRIGGSEYPFIEGRAAFSIVDNSLKACSDIPGDECPKPWDYCCETDKLPTGTALIKVVDDQGNLIQADAKPLLGVKELSTVVVSGTAKRDDAGNMTVLASGIFIKQK